MATATVTCIDAITGQQLPNASFYIYYSEDATNNQRTYVNAIEKIAGSFTLTNLKDGIYYLVETEAPFFDVEIEDENCDFFTKTQSYKLKEETRFEINAQDKSIAIEHFPAKIDYSESSTTKIKQFFINRQNSAKELTELFSRSHELNDKEFSRLTKYIALLVCFCMVAFLGLINPVIQSILPLSNLSKITLTLGICCLIFGFGLFKLNKFSKPRNRVLDKIPEPIRKGENVGLYGSGEIITDPKTIKKILNSTNCLNEIEIDDPGVYCGYYQPSTLKRFWNVIANIINRRTKFNVHKFSGYYCFIPDDCHAIIYGDTRAGKTRRVLLSTIHLISRGKKESFIIFDSKREILAFTSEKLQKEGYDIKVYDFEHPENSTRHNPLYVAIDLIKQGKLNEAMQEVSERVNALVAPEVLSGENKFFYEGAMNLIKAVALAILCDDECPQDQKTFTTVSRMIEGQITKQAVDKAKPNGMKFSPFEEYITKFPFDHIVNIAYSPLRQVEDRHIMNFISTAQQLVSIFRDPSIEDMTRITENPFKNIAEQKQAVFIVAPSNKQAYKSLATMFLDQMYSEIRSEANDDTIVNGVHQVGRTARRVNFICEEILSINPWAKLMDALNEGAGLGLRFFLIIQNQQLFNQKYGKEEAEGIKPNCANQMLITTGDPQETVAHWLKMIGTMTVESVSRVVAGSRFSPVKSNSSETRAPCKRACLDSAEIQGWNANCGILIKTKLHENVLNVPLPDVSCTPTEEYFNLGTKQDNLEKAAKILRKNFKMNKNLKVSKTPWLPGIVDAQNTRYSNEDYKKILIQQRQKYKEHFTERVALENKLANESANGKVGLAWNIKTGKYETFNNMKDYNSAIYSLKFSKDAGWKIKTFESQYDLETFINNFTTEFNTKNKGKKDEDLFKTA